MVTTIAISPLAAALSLEQALADPYDDKASGSFQKAVWDDRQSAFPEQLCHAAQDWGIAEQLIPRECGGELAGLEDLLEVCRVVSRRDLTAAVAFGATFLAALPVWLRGRDGQKQTVAALLRSGAFLSFALSERDHGADVSAGETTGRRDGDGWRIDGEKWLINNSGHARAATVVTRTGNGPRGLTMFLVPLPQGGSTGWTRLPKISTHGLRGSEIGGLSFSDLRVGGTDVIGRVGTGLETGLETLQITRVLLAGCALGALDTCLRRALGFAHARRLYGSPIQALEPVRRRLVDAFADLLVGETLAAGACRAALALPEQLPLQSLCTKYLIPEAAMDAIESLSVVLGARSYVADPDQDAIFEKMRRDCAVTELFDGSAPVVLGGLVGQLPALARDRAAAAEPGPDIAGPGALRGLFGPRPPDGQPDRIDADLLTLDTDRDTVVSGLDEAAALLGGGPVAELAEERKDLLLDLVQRCRSALSDIDAEVVARAGDPRWRRSAEAYDLTARYTHLHAAGACAWRWLAWREAAESHPGSVESAGSADRADPAARFIQDGGWLALCLRQSARRAAVLPERCALDPVDDAAFALLGRLYEENLAFRAQRFPLAGGCADAAR